jgi:hypothetical protein
VYTEDEWERLPAKPRRFVRDIAAQAFWVFERPGCSA